VGENAYERGARVLPLVVAVVAWSVEVGMGAVAVVMVAVAAGQMMAEEHAGVQARDAEPRRALSLLRCAKEWGESPSLRARG